eukprot:CAMPEP_0185780446 /NCGR_PEP_ID=MMETSP1174-20130828/99151_1 /TAXON_ID=35687 /ORGANISM="Dictyocha speculum, Strain CCMP1381" /LENGTH=61 /DNA_ID=CAMNT_0028470017 /DNA_START=541 /DNA_END=726 /DNA_ORIENTATION=-
MFRESTGSLGDYKKNRPRARHLEGDHPLAPTSRVGAERMTKIYPITAIEEHEVGVSCSFGD